MLLRPCRCGASLIASCRLHERAVLKLLGGGPPSPTAPARSRVFSGGYSRAKSKPSCGSSGKHQFDLSNCIVAREAIIRFELQSDTRIGLADEERRLPRRGDTFYVTLGENARAHLRICGPQNDPDKHRLSRREVLSALPNSSAILLFCSCTRRFESAGHFMSRILRGLEQCARQDAEIGVRLFCSDCPCRHAEDRCDDQGR